MALRIYGCIGHGQREEISSVYLYPFSAETPGDVVSHPVFGVRYYSGRAAHRCTLSMKQRNAFSLSRHREI